jgi:hypothetical protein
MLWSELDLALDQVAMDELLLQWSQQAEGDG